jgi:hypothetical protein
MDKLSKYTKQCYIETAFHCFVNLKNKNKNNIVKKQFYLDDWKYIFSLIY